MAVCVDIEPRFLYLDVAMQCVPLVSVVAHTRLRGFPCAQSIVNVIGMSKMTPPIRDLLPRLTPILKNRHAIPWW
jgi:hypothetical protein